MLFIKYPRKVKYKKLSCFVLRKYFIKDLAIVNSSYGGNTIQELSKTVHCGKNPSAKETMLYKIYFYKVEYFYQHDRGHIKQHTTHYKRNVCT